MADNKGNLPESTPERRAQACALSAEARRYRAAAKKRIKAGRASLADGLADDKLARMRVGELVGAVPGVGRVRAAAALQSLGIDPDRRLAKLGARQREALVAWADGEASSTKGGE